MWTSLALLASLLGVVACRPLINSSYGNFSTAPVSYEYMQWLEQNLPKQRVTYPSNFKFMYFSQSGQIQADHKPSTGHFIRIVGSPHTTKPVLYVAALELVRMMKYVPPHIFNNIANSEGGLGVFTKSEGVTVFPDFAHLADTPECQGRCDGTCSRTCTFDGRKLATLSGVTSTLALVLDDNFMCKANDPYHHRDNILMHEFAHMVNRNGMTSQEKTQNQNIYNHAKNNRLWDLNTYAMANKAEYFAEATGAFFLVNMQTGGMTTCSYGECRSITDARSHIQSRDPQLYNFLVHIWTNGHANRDSGVKTCYEH